MQYWASQMKEADSLRQPEEARVGEGTGGSRAKGIDVPPPPRWCHPRRQGGLPTA
jgi:hypothetical protein